MAERHIYFVQAVTGGPIKIGTAIDIADRLKSLQTGSAAILCLLASLPGTIKEEKALQRQLKEHRISGEWFAPHDDVLAIVNSVKDGAGIGDVVQKRERPTWKARSDEEAILRETFADTIIAAYGRKRGWRRQLAQDANVTVDCVKRWLQRRCLPQCAQLVILGRNCPAVKDWTISVMAALMQAPATGRPIQPPLPVGNSTEVRQ